MKATDAEKLCMIDRAYALDTARKAARRVADLLTAIELCDDGEKAGDLRVKLASARDADSLATTAVLAVLAEPVPKARSADGPLFDKGDEDPVLAKSRKGGVDKPWDEGAAAHRSPNTTLREPNVMVEARDG